MLILIVWEMALILREIRSRTLLPGLVVRSSGKPLAGQNADNMSVKTGSRPDVGPIKEVRTLRTACCMVIVVLSVLVSPGPSLLGAAGKVTTGVPKHTRRPSARRLAVRRPTERRATHPTRPRRTASEARRHYLAGDRAYQQGDYDAAIAEWKKTLRLKPSGHTKRRIAEAARRRDQEQLTAWAGLAAEANRRSAPREAPAAQPAPPSYSLADLREGLAGAVQSWMRNSEQVQAYTVKEYQVFKLRWNSSEYPAGVVPGTSDRARLAAGYDYSGVVKADGPYNARVYISCYHKLGDPPTTWYVDSVF